LKIEAELSFAGERVVGLFLRFEAPCPVFSATYPVDEKN
jgi:hypothetical protein